mmetsp:Transcript_22516/g.64765  ORF Transcript_22516/g.64765 Transcript_22516/m.64765 type:complete len:211 (+) Transcript_22516:119-751(+)
MHRPQPSLLLLAAALLLSPQSSAFVVQAPQTTPKAIHQQQRQSIINTRPTDRKWSAAIHSSSASSDDFADDGAAGAALAPLSGNRQKAWQHARKPLLRLGGQGAKLSHGNSLRELLDQHTVVKVKVNPGPFGGSLLRAFEALKALAVESGADEGLELVHVRTSENVIMFGRAGALAVIDAGEFPPPPPPPREEVDGEEGRARRIREEESE